MYTHRIDVGDWKENLLERYLDRGSIQQYEAAPSENVYFAAHQIVVAASDVDLLRPALGRLGARVVEDATVLPNSPTRPSADTIAALGSRYASQARQALVRSRGDLGLGLDDGGATDQLAVSPTVTFRIDERVNPAEVVLDLRNRRARRSAQVSLNHLVTGSQFRRGMPDGDPEPVDDTFASMQGGRDLPGWGVGVAVVDTGFPVRWPASNDWFDRNLSWASLPGEADHVDLLDEANDGFLDAEAGHGYFVAGMVRRVAPGASLWFLRALDSNGMGTEEGVARVIRQAVRRPIRVLNLSLGFYTLQNTTSLGVAAAVAAARRARPGLVIVAAAGNDGLVQPAFPAASKHVIGVGALDEKNARLASFSNRGPWIDVNAPGTFLHGPYVEGVEDVALTRDGNADRFDGRARWSGTSFATGLVSGTVAAALTGTAPGADAVAAADLIDKLPPLPGAFGGRLDPVEVLV